MLCSLADYFRMSIPVEDAIVYRGSRRMPCWKYFRRVISVQWEIILIQKWDI
jgi:hypothetical protein